MKTPRRIVALALCCAGLVALLAIPGVAAQATTDYDTDNDGLIEVNSLERLNAIRWDLDGDGTADNPTASTDPDDANSDTQGDAYAAAFPNAAAGMGCPTTPYDHDGDSSSSQVTGCIGYELTGNLNFNGSQWASGWGDGKGWEPIGIYTGTGGSPYGTPFTRIFDGNNHTISNLYVNRPDESGVGLFGNVGAYQSHPSTIRNLQLHIDSVKGADAVGALVGNINYNYSSGMICNSEDKAVICNSSVTGGTGATVTGVIVGTGYQRTGGRDIGGLAGSSSGPISNSSAAVTVTGRHEVGGLVGYSLDPITNSHASGDVSGEDDVGGLVGRNDDDIIRSYATGDVTGTGDDGGSSVGGLVGTHWYDGSTISNSYASGHVTGTTFVGGLVGMAWGGDIQTSYATGDVTGKNLTDSNGFQHWAGRIGGLLGSTRGATISTSFAKGAVEGMHHVGGLVGENIGQTIRATYAHGDVTVIGGGEGSSCQSDRDPGCRIGGLVGTNIGGGAIINSYAIGLLDVEANHNRVGGFAGESPTERLYNNVGHVEPGSITGSYWDTETSEFPVGVGTDDGNNNRVIDERDLRARPPVFGETEQDGVGGKTTSELQTPTDYTGIYEAWDDDPDLDLDNADGDNDHATGKDAPWYFGENDEYPVLKIDVDRDGDVDQDDYDDQQPGPPNQRPTVSIGIPVTQPVDGGTRVTPTVTASDPDGSISSYAWSTTGGTFANAATRNATWTAPAEQPTEQTYRLTLRVTDDGGATASATVDIRVRAANMLPTVSIQPVTQEVAGGANVTFNATAEDPDPDGSIASYDWNAPTGGGTFVDDKIEDATWTAPAEQATAQTYTLTLTVTDNRGGKTTVEVEITVQATNQAPRVTIHTGTRTVDGGDVVTLFATSEDPDQDGSIVSYLWTATNDAGTFGNAADEDTTWTAPAKTSNEQRIELTLTATDNEGGTGDASVIIKVAANNQPTASITTPEQEVDGGDVVTLQATATDDDDTTLTYQWTANPDVGVFSDAAILEPSWTAPAKEIDEQEVTLTLSVSDGTSTSTAQVTITVLANNAPEAAIQTAEQEVVGGAEVNLQATADDDDTNDTLTYAWTADDGDANTADDGTFSDPAVLEPTWTAPAKTNAGRPILLTLTVSDGLTSHTVSVVITVEANVAPEATIITQAHEVDGGGDVVLQATATDDDDDANTLTYQWSADDGTFSDDEALTPTWTAPDRANAAQTIALTLTVTDPGGLTGTDTVTITVDSNQSPTVSIGTGFQLVDGGDEITLDATASDPDQDTLTIAWTATGGTFADDAIEDAVWTAPDTQNTAQAIRLTLKVSDPDGLSAIATVNFTVRANRAPGVTIDTNSQTVDGGATVNLVATVDDQDTGDTHTYQWHADGGTFDDDATEDPTWTAPAAQNVPRSYTLTLIVTDSGNLTGSDAITITVSDDSTEPDPNTAPTVTITTGSKIVAGGAEVSLEADSSDTDQGDTLTYSWTGQGTFADDAAEDTTWTAPTRLSAAQPILLTLTVTDSGGLKAVDTVVMTVSANSLPEVEITSDFQQPVDGNAEVQLFANASDPDNDDLTYQWSADPDRGSFDDAATLDTTWTAPDAASTDQAYTLSLTVEDSGGLQVGDAITVIVRANQSPTVEISTAAQTVDGGDEITLDATASDPDDEDNTLKYQWTANPNYGNFANANALTTTWTALPTPDTSLPIDLTLTVTDPDGLEATDNVTITVRGSTTAPPPPPPRPPRPPDRGDDGDDGDGGDGGGGGGDGDGGGGGGGGGSGTSEYPKLIGENGSAKAWELANNSVLLQIHNPDDPDNPREVTFGIGSINSEGTEIVPVGYVRDDSLGQTYAVLRRQSDGEIVRRWIAPDSPVALIVPWEKVNSKYTFPVLVIVTIPLDEKRPHPNQLVRRFDGGDDRILSYDVDLLQWRHVPDAATFQVLEFYWCDVTAADVGFFDRIHIGIPHPPTTVPARDDYPSCRP